MANPNDCSAAVSLRSPRGWMPSYCGKNSRAAFDRRVQRVACKKVVNVDLLSKAI